MLVLKTLIFTVFVPGTATVVLPYFLLLSDLQFALQAPRFVRLAGMQFLGIGGAMYLWCAWDFVVAGGGTLNPADPPRFLVSRGLYRRLRNPMYAAVCLVLCGEALLFDSLTLLIYAAALWSLLHLRVIRYEEPQLRRRFGDPYGDYCRAVPRWIPRGARGAGER